VSWKSSFGTAFAGVAGVAVGVAGAVFFLPGLVQSRREQAPLRQALNEPRAPLSLPSLGTSDGVRVSALEQRLAALEQRPESAASPTPAPIPELPKDPAQAAADERAAFQSVLDAHELEPRNTAWSQSASPRFEADLGKLAAQGGFAVDRIDCRASTCVVDLDWPSESQARAGWHSLLTYDYGVNCQRNVLLREEPDARGRLHADLVFDCSRATAQASN
jgi:hypothetical protein